MKQSGFHEEAFHAGNGGRIPSLGNRRLPRLSSVLDLSQTVHESETGAWFLEGEVHLMRCMHVRLRASAMWVLARIDLGSHKAMKAFICQSIPRSYQQKGGGDFRFNGPLAATSPTSHARPVRDAG